MQQCTKNEVCEVTIKKKCVNVIIHVLKKQKEKNPKHVVLYVVCIWGGVVMCETVLILLRIHL